MSGVGAFVRRLTGGAMPPVSRPAPFFGTLRTLLGLWAIGITNKRAAQEAQLVGRRRGVSAKSPYARAKGRFQGHSRLQRATGPGSYSQHDKIVAAQLAGNNFEAERLAVAHAQQMSHFNWKRQPGRIRLAATYSS